MNECRAVLGCLVGMGVLPKGGMVLDLARSLLVKYFYMPSKRKMAEESLGQQGASSLASGVTTALMCLGVSLHMTVAL